MSKLTFLGATGTVTGSKFLVEHEGCRLLVDCGLFQGVKELRQRNWNPLAVDPKKVDLVVLTHAHLDHSGYLPLFVRNGFGGPVLATSATCDLCGILLPDSGYLQEEDARFANKHGFSRHQPALPLYTELEARKSLARLRSIPFDETVQVHPRISLRFRPAGHILGAANVELRLAGAGPGGAEKVILFSGDLGRPKQPILPAPAALVACDHLLLESTYGNRDHSKADPRDRLAELIGDVVQAGGTMVIPAFAVGRTQTALYLLRELQQQGRVPAGLPIHVDSPMAVHAIRIFMEHREAQHLEMRTQVSQGHDPLGLRDVHLVSSVEESKALNTTPGPSIIVSASGMATGGRVLHHLVQRLPDPQNVVLLVGFQAAGTRGRALADGASEIQIHGRKIPVRARVEMLEGLSAHADRSEILDWLAGAQRAPGRTYLVHGEPEASQALAELIREKCGLDVRVPAYLESVEL